ncbi:MAG TPA: sialidase family protein [Thermoanaerobaculia bacterium]|nr:sialidase family protein [Thermoanaerobaculia bacterium]
MNRPALRATSRIVLLLSLGFAAARAGQPQAVQVINMIPNSLSGETNRDSEPNVAVNPANPSQIAATAFTPDPLNSGSGPIFVSTDGGLTWTLNVVLPGGNRTVDVTLRFGGTSNVLYAGILRSDNSHLSLLRKANYLAAGLMTVLVDRANEDQPYTQATTVLGGPGVGLDRVYIGHNDFNAPAGKTATVEQSLDAATAAPPANLTSQRIEVRTTCGQDGPSIRPAMHADGTVYAAFFRWSAGCGGGSNTADVIVVRDNLWGTGAPSYQAITDGGFAGVRVATGVTIASLSTLLGTQRIGSSLSIAVDPRNSRTVYVAWGDGTTANTYTLHVRQSTDGGATWSADRRAIVKATNPSLAVNTSGRVAFLYQKLTGSPGSQRWETHLERSDNGFTTAPTDVILANVPDANGTYVGVNPIGDYTHMMAVGKNFYGVFSGNNTPDMANFPSGITYQRNVDWVGHVLKDLANQPVTVSIDPFFFRTTELAAQDDFYVRDWTDGPGNGDTGLEPSTHSVFYATSDVWNRRGTLPGTFVNDQPPSEPAGNGAGNIGDNWAFARIRRNALPVSGSKTVTAHFLISKFGTGSNYVDSTVGDPDLSFPDPDPTLNFTAADLGPFITTAWHWHLNAIASTHLCMAVEISAPGDPFVAPSLVGSAPGWPTTDLRVIFDNNKAQRNLSLSTTPARGIGGIDTYGIVHNAATFRRDIVLRTQVSPDVAPRLLGASIQLIGGTAQPFRPGDTIVIPDVQPGENRWVGLTFQTSGGKEGDTLPVELQEMVGNTPVNGFTLAAQLASINTVILQNLEIHRSVLTRLAAGGFDPQAQKEADAAASLLKLGDQVTESQYSDFVKSSSLTSLASRYLGTGADLFSIQKAISGLTSAVGSGVVDQVAVAHPALLNRLDSLVTQRALDAGDVADVLQMVRWQSDLYKQLPATLAPQCSASLLDQSAAFIDAYQQRKAGAKDYAGFLTPLFDCFDQTAKTLGSTAAESALATLEGSVSDPTALEKAHRAFLLALQDAVPPQQTTVAVK